MHPNTPDDLKVSPEMLLRPIPTPLPDTTADVEPLTTIAGQNRAQNAIRFGLKMNVEGFNIAVPGATASGRGMIIHHLVDEAASEMPPPSDWAYLHSFVDPRRPQAVALAPGMGGDLQRGLASLIEVCRNDLPKALESDSYSQRRDKVLEPFGAQRQARMEELEQLARSRNVALNATPMGLVPIAIDDEGQPLTSDAFNALSEERRTEITVELTGVQEELQVALRDVRRFDLDARTAVQALDKETTEFVVGPLLDDLDRRFPEERVREHLKAVREDISENLASYRRFGESQGEQVPPQVLAQAVEEREMLLRRYGANLFVTHGEEPAERAPVIDERHYGFRNLFGWIDYENRQGTMVTDFTRIHPGAIHRANGGFLILQILDLLADPRAWVKLKRTLQTHEARFEDPSDIGIGFPVASLQPEGVPIDIKVIVVGTGMTFAMLASVDPEFDELFRVRAEFEPDVPADQENIDSYVAFVRRTADENSLRHFDSGALEEIVRHSSRLAGRQDKLTARYGLIADLCHESNRSADEVSADLVSAAHVQAAVEARRVRSSLVPDRLREMIVEGTLHVATAGSVVGQVNGLAVYTIGAYAFGTPARITCRVGAGRRGIVAIERETERSGAIHTKGVLVLSGYLQGTFGAERPLAFTASLTFEQSYEEVEGDSASSAELLAILASLAGVAIRQDVAVTGSVDQFGAVQAVGGVTQKVEGFFDVCQAIGLTGTQGVVIPASNVVNLTLRPDLLESVSDGRFHIWAVNRIEQTIAILTGVEAGEKDESGVYGEGTVYRQVSDRLDRMSEEAKPQS